MTVNGLEATDISLVAVAVFAPWVLVIMLALVKGYEIRVTRPKPGKHERLTINK